jgi:hypothetical protein
MPTMHQVLYQTWQTAASQTDMYVSFMDEHLAYICLTIFEYERVLRLLMAHAHDLIITANNFPESVDL